MAKQCNFYTFISKEVLFLLSDGLSNSGPDPVPIATRLRRDGVVIFAFAIGRLLRDWGVDLTGFKDRVFDYPNFREFKRLARRIRGDPQASMWISAPNRGDCDSLCANPNQDYGCCDPAAMCSCGFTPVYACICKPGFFSMTGLFGECKACPTGTYKSTFDISSSCSRCPKHSITAFEEADDVADCVCIKNYRGNPSKGLPCSLIVCPYLKPPRDGWIVKSRGNRLLGSTIQFVCKFGYKLRDQTSEKRRCTLDGTWTGSSPVCFETTCPSLSYFANGKTVCDSINSKVGSKCKFKCNQGYFKSGRDIRCMVNGQWSRKMPTCKQITCPVLSKPKHGQIHPKDCRTKQMPAVYGACLFNCNQGYAMKGLSIVHCGDDGKWRSPDHKLFSRSSKIKCHDVEPPTFRHCSQNLTFETYPGSAYAEVKWLEPIATDNSHSQPKVMVTPNWKSPRKIPIGTHTLKYQAMDTSGLTAKCAINIIVLDKEAPKILNCPKDINTFGPSNYTDVQWAPPQFVDNSGDNVTDIIISEPTGLLRWGVYPILYEATDKFGNKAECSFNINVTKRSCPDYEPPINGAVACDSWRRGEFCRVSCNNEYGFSSKPAELYICDGSETLKTSPAGMAVPWPDCSERYDANMVRLAMTQYFKGRCTNEKTQIQIKKAFLVALDRHMKDQMSDICDWRKSTTDCSVASVDVHCGRVVNNGARRRRDVKAINTMIKIDFGIEIKANDSMQLKDLVRNVKENLKKSIVNGVLNIENEQMVAYGKLEVKETLICKAGSVLRDSFCVKCPVGRFFNEDRGECDACPAGWYQDEEGSLNCKACDNGTWTIGMQAKHYTSCKEICKPGTHSTTGLATCLTCPVGTYQSKHQQTSCTSCPEHMTTVRPATESLRGCKYLCAPGTLSDSGLEPCTECHRGTYQQDEGQPRCLSCGIGQTTHKKRSTLESQCVFIDFCAFNDSLCFNGGTCESTPDGYSCHCPSGYSGPRCTVDVDDCINSPCSNNGTCIDNLGGYTCACSDQFTGPECEMEVDDCDPNPCQHDGTCMDLLGGFECLCLSGWTGVACSEADDPCSDVSCEHGFCVLGMSGDPECQCLPGYAGWQCETFVDACDDNPCHHGECNQTMDGFECLCPEDRSGVRCEEKMNNCLHINCSHGGHCQDEEGGYRCVCSQLRMGKNCEQALEAVFRLSFSGGVDHAYASVNSDLDAFTMSFAIKSIVTDQDSTLLSYAVMDDSNNPEQTIVVVLEESLILYINQEEVILDVDLRDGNMNYVHIVCNLTGGYWSVQINDSAAVNGTFFTAQKPINGGGLLMLGQYQHALGGGFDPSEAFVGDIFRFNMWSLILKTEEARGDCSFGNIVAWPTFQKYLYGNLSMVTKQAHDCI